VASRLRAQLIGALSDSDSVFLDLCALEFMDSSGIHALAAADARARAMGKALVVAHPTRAVLRLLELTGMTEVLRIVDDSGPIAA
jgi:anti-anti-sigma factor